MKYARKRFRVKKENGAIKDRIIKDIKTLLESEKEDYYKPVRIGNFYRNNYIEYGSNDDKNKTTSIKKYLEEIKPYLKDVINNFKKVTDTWKIQSTMTIMSSKDIADERVMHSKSDNIENMICKKTEEFIKELLKIMGIYILNKL